MKKLKNLKELNPYLDWWSLKSSKDAKKVKSYKEDDEGITVEIYYIEKLDIHIKVEARESSYTGELEMDTISFVEESDITVTNYLDGKASGSAIIAKLEEIGKMSDSQLKEIGHDIYEPMTVENFGLGNVIGKKLPLGIGEWQEVHRQSYMGEEFISIKYFKDHDVYIKTVGFTSSYDKEVTFEDGYGTEVSPKEKTITTYT